MGNLLSISKKADTHSACAPTLLNLGVNTKNQISDPGFVYDAAGNLTNTPNPGGLAMQYDAENRMTSAAGVTYSYDGDGKRVAKSNGKLYWYPSASLGAGGMSSDPLFETDAAGAVSDEFIFFAGKRTARKKSPSGEINYYFADHLGSSRVVTSAAGAILDDSDFYPFGKEVPFASATDNSYLFTGKERDAESGLDFFIARYYSSQYGRFLSPDEFTGGPVDAFSSNDPAPPATLPYANITNPQSLNKYTYTWNNPLRYTDPNGHCPGCVLQVLEFADRFTRNVGGFAKDFAIGFGKQLLSNVRQSLELKPAPELDRTNDVQRAGAAAVGPTVTAAAVIVPLGSKGTGGNVRMNNARGQGECPSFRWR
jgi:RHS repeat-associated protein